MAISVTKTSLFGKKFLLSNNKQYLINFVLLQSLVLKEGSKNYVNWIETPIPMYFEVYLYNWDNPNDLGSKTIKPHFTQKGPYVFKEVHKRVGLDWNDNSTVSYNQTRTWHFLPEKSNGSLDDEITNINVIATTVALITRQSFALKLAIDALFIEQNTQLFIKKTARELIFDGYNDPILEFLKNMKHLLPINLPIPEIPFTKFGWFAERNNSADYDGRFTIFTGADDINKLGLMNLWNHQKKSPFYRKDCRELKGTTGELWPPVKKGNDISVFATDLCRSLTLKYDCEISKFGLTGSKWSGDDRVFDNGAKYPSQLCFCTSDEELCPDMPYGVGNMSDCRFGAPAFASFPHFYLAHESFMNAIDGLAAPNKKNDEFYIALEPTTGIPMEVNAQLQINILLQPVSNLL